NAAPSSGVAAGSCLGKSTGGGLEPHAARAPKAKLALEIYGCGSSRAITWYFRLLVGSTANGNCKACLSGWKARTIHRYNDFRRWAALYADQAHAGTGAFD